jgi:hypothetical protein
MNKKRMKIAQNNNNRRLKVKKGKQERINVCSRSQLCSIPLTMFGIEYMWLVLKVCTGQNFRIASGPARGPFGRSPKFISKCVTRTRPTKESPEKAGNIVYNI